MVENRSPKKSTSSSSALPSTTTSTMSASEAFAPRPGEADERALLVRHRAAVENFRSGLPAPPPMSEVRPSTVVAVRCRPVLPAHDLGAESTFEAVTVNGPNVYVHKEKTIAGLASGKMANKKYTLHSSHGPESKDDSIYRELVRPVVVDALSGGSGACIAYGQVGSGKTYTMNQIARRAAPDVSDQIVSFSFFELRGDVCTDGLDESATKDVLTDENNETVVKDLTSKPIGSLDELLATLAHCHSIRATANTRSNSQSSRSHAFYVFNVRGGGSLKLCDLAGSESKADAMSHASDANAEERLKEMAEINKSLGDLKECIRLTLANAKSERQHVPFRRSLLTRLLKDALELGRKNAKAAACFIAHVSPLRSNLPQTMNTLTYAEYMIAASRASTEKKKFVGPETWSPKKLAIWVGTFNEGKHAKLAEVFHISGKQLHIMWKGDVDKRVLAAGGTQADADDIYDTFHDMVKKAKKKNRAAAGKREAGGGAKQSGDITIEIAEGPANMMYGSGLSDNCVENN